MFEIKIIKTNYFRVMSPDKMLTNEKPFEGLKIISPEKTNKNSGILSNNLIEIHFEATEDVFRNQQIVFDSNNKQARILNHKKGYLSLELLEPYIRNKDFIKGTCF